MPRRRMAGIAVGCVSVIATAAAAVVALSAGPSEHVALPYFSHHTFVSTAAGACVESTVRGTATGTRIGTVPFVRWTGVHLSDPTVTAAGYELVEGRCDHAHPVRLGATMQQTWSADGAIPVSRRTDQGPASAALRQFNSGAPVDLPDRGLPAALFGPDYAIDGRILIDARFASGSEGFGYRTRVALDVSTH